MKLSHITLIDGYKLDHRRQYPPNTTRVYSNFTPRGSRIPDTDAAVFVGLQVFLEHHLEKGTRKLFYGDIDYQCKQYERRVNGYLGPNTIGSEHIRDLRKLGYLPLEFRAVPEGTLVPLRTPALTVENTHDDFAWLVNYYETLMSCSLWQPCTSATLARRLRILLESWAAKTGTAKEFIDWQGHDFSFRGMAGPEAAAMSGLGHLLFFTGTDTIPAIDIAEEYYGVPDGYMVGGSVAATEHSVMCAGGEDDELSTYRRILNLYPSGIVSVVSDTWDLWKVLTDILPTLKEQIMGREGKLVIRPDSGDPTKIMAGDDSASAGSPARKGVVECLWDVFGGSVNAAGYKELDPHVGVIYGDSINYERADGICTALAAKGFASGNTVLGVGSFTYQFVTRDTLNWAMKATAVRIAGQDRAIFKAPKTDDGAKNSARGRLAVICQDGKHVLVNDATPEQEAASVLQPVWRDGRFLKRYTFDQVRANARATLP